MVCSLPVNLDKQALIFYWSVDTGRHFSTEFLPGTLIISVDFKIEYTFCVFPLRTKNEENEK